MPTFSEVVDTIRQTFKDDFHAKRPGVPIGFENLSRLIDDNGDFVEKPDSSEWVNLRIQHGNGSQIGLGETRVFRYPGVVSVQIYVPVKQGDGLAYAIADDVKEVFRGQTISDVRFRSPGLARGGPDGAFWLLTVNTQFDFDEFV